MHIFIPDHGVSGDMLLGSLLSLSDIEPRDIRPILEVAGSAMGETKVSLRCIAKGTRKGYQLNVRHGTFSEVAATMLRTYLEKALDYLKLGRKGERFTLDTLDTLLRAESKVHGVPVSKLHLHETGSPDTLVDLVGIGYLHEHMKMKRIFSTPIAAGSGTLRTAHGVFTVPPPAVAEMLKGMEWFPGPFNGEMATPTGVAALKNLIDGFLGSPPGPFSPISVGIGIGNRKFNGKFGYLRIVEV